MSRRNLDRNHLGICCWLFAVVIILGTSAVVAWLSLTPKNPQFRISDLRFTALDSINGTSSHANNSLIFDLEIFNPNKRMGIYYDDISLRLYSSGVVGMNSTTAFYQGYENTTLFQMVVHAEEGFWRGANGRNFNFMVRVETAVRFRIIKWKTKTSRIEYETRFTNAKISVNGTLPGGKYTEVLSTSKADSGN